ncbi:hypothetical protein QYF61_016145 [Mycteria americana]|uniref:Uncharacterized protein n=1 Tax=Mycteria americana TaxID=33587 RepID=A0AAN7PK20_MYCAM|nr:hypothetical protein QYF61_016145 [Mycteria americana]
MVGFLGCKRTLPGHVELLINQHPQVLLLRAALNPSSAQPVFVLGIALNHVQDLSLGLVELRKVHMGPPLKPAKVPLDGIPSLQRVDCTTQLGVVHKLAEGALNPTVHVTNKDVKQCRSQLDTWNQLVYCVQFWAPQYRKDVDLSEEGREGKGREGKGREGKGREGKGREGKGREGKGREGKGREGKGREGKGREGKERKGKERKGKERKGKERKGKERKGKERKGKERKGKERKGKERKGKERKGKERKGKERKGKERKGKERKGKERKGKERKGKERKGKERGERINRKLRLNNYNALSLSSEERLSSPLIIFMAFLWTCSNRSMSFLYWGPQSWTQYSRWILMSME